MAQYLDNFPAPFLDDLIQSRCVPFIGAGFSRNAKLPPGKDLPTWDALGQQIANLIHNYDYKNALDAISAYSHEYSRVKLVEQLTRSLHINIAQPGGAHAAFCELPFDVVCTTNFEFLLERGYELANRYCRPITEEDQLAIDVVGQSVLLLKIHGDLHHPNRLIVTEDDYDAFLDRYPLLATYLANLLISKTALFIGYSLDDSDFRQIWNIITSRLGKMRRPAYTILVSPQSQVVARFERRGVKVIQLPGKSADYGAILETVFKELREHWTQQLRQASTATEEETAVELAMPMTAASRLCFMAVPTRLLPLYKMHIYPLIEKHGFAPVAAVDVVAPGDSIFAKITSLIERAELVVLDAGSPNSVEEFKTAISKGPNKRILIVAEAGTILPSELTGLMYLRRPQEMALDEETDRFLTLVNSWFEDAARSLRSTFESEPTRLLSKGEYRAAVIAAITLLENELRTRIQVPQPIHTFTRLIDEALEQQIIPNDTTSATILRRQLRNWYSTRSRLVHMDANISATASRTIVEGVTKILGSMPS